MNRPFGVSLIAVLSIINGILRLFVPVAVFGVGLFSLIGGEGATRAMGGLAMLFGIVGGIVGVLLIATGVGLWRLQGWARTFALILSGVAIASGVVELFFSFQGGDGWSCLSDRQHPAECDSALVPVHGQRQGSVRRVGNAVAMPRVFAAESGGVARMSDEKKYMVYGGSYANEEDATKDYDEVSFAYERDDIGGYEVAIFAKKDDGKVDIINTRASRRGAGAAWGAGAAGVATVAVVGLMFPFALAGGLAAGATAGAILGDWSKAFGRKDVKEMGEALDAGQFGVVVVAEVKKDLPVEKLLAHAVKSEAREIPDAKAVHKYLKDEDVE